MIRGRGQTPFAKVAYTKPDPIGPEYNPWFWNPNRGSFRSAPPSFQEKLEAFDKDLRVVWNPITERWLVWVRSPRINNPICQGWRLLFIHHDVDHSYLPLDERVFARLVAANIDRDGTALKYFDRVTSEMQRDKEKAEKAALNDTIDHAMETWEHSRIKNINSGSNFSKYHA